MVRSSPLSRRGVPGRVSFGMVRLGTDNASAKLNPVKVRLIRRLWSWQEFTLNELAALFGVSVTSIRRVVTDATWWHVPSGGSIVDY